MCWHKFPPNRLRVYTVMVGYQIVQRNSSRTDVEDFPQHTTGSSLIYSQKTFPYISRTNRTNIESHTLFPYAWTNFCVALIGSHTTKCAHPNVVAVPYKYIRIVSYRFVFGSQLDFCCANHYCRVTRIINNNNNNNNVQALAWVDSACVVRVFI